MYFQKAGRSILFYNLIIISLAAVITVWGRYAYQNKIEDAALRENRFITTEWHLLQIIKNQAEEELEKKNQEIRRLQAQYELLKARRLGPDSLREIEDKIKTIEDERDTILEQMTLSLSDDRAVDTGAGITLPLLTAGLSVSDNLQREELKTLQDYKLAAEREIEVLNEALRNLESEKQTLEFTSDMNQQELQEQILSREKALLELDSGIDDVRQYLIQNLNPDNTGKTMDITSLYKFELINIILDLPQIRNEYPGLKEELQLYIDKVSAIEKLSAQQDLYAELLVIMEETFGSD
ncbi:MAG: hypothetical protein PQJ58_00420 [Spirochaetales bacterium]|nr:hypothetical protein [Spirochaetales bacterium]